MSFLEKMVGKKQASLTTSETIQRLQEIEEMLMRKQEYLEVKIEREYLTAKNNTTKNKPVALQALRRKKRLEKQLKQIDNTLGTIEVQKEALDVATTNTAVLKILKNAANVLKSKNLNIDINKVNEMMDDVADQQELVNEIANAISNPVGFNDDIDEDELEKELEALEEEILAEKLLTVPDLQKFPKIPAGGIGSSQKSDSKTENNDEEEMNILEQWAS